MNDTLEILKIQDLEPFPDHPFQVQEDDAISLKRKRVNPLSMSIRGKPISLFPKQRTTPPTRNSGRPCWK